MQGFLKNECDGWILIGMLIFLASVGIIGTLVKQNRVETFPPKESAFAGEN